MRFSIFCLIFFALVTASCRTTQNSDVTVSPSPQIQPSPAIIKNETLQAVVDVPRLAGKSTFEVDEILGKPETVKQIKKPAGEYRVYKIPNHPKGLAVRFYGDKAIDFNLILSAPLPTSKQSLKEVFGIDVGDAPFKIDSKEPLSEVWRGTFNGVRFAKVYAKRESENGGFIFVLAEVAQ
ncbi:MAG TPA: hypothetical protein VF571_19340 [Pyrinomonadaceae bacterium]|jgi:hypothetical protein